MNHSKITVNTSEIRPLQQHVNEYHYTSSNQDNKDGEATTVLKINVKSDDIDDDSNRKRSSSVNPRTGASTLRSNVLEETTTYKYINQQKRPRRLSIDSVKQFPMRNSTTTNQYYNTSQAAFYPTWDDWKRQHYQEKKQQQQQQQPPKMQHTSNEINDQKNKAIYEETSMFNKYSSSSTTTGATTNNNNTEIKIPNQLESISSNERIKKLEHNERKKENNDVYELQIDNKQQSSFNNNKQQENQQRDKFEIGIQKDITDKKSYTFTDKLMQTYFDEMENKRRTLLNNDNVSLVHSVRNNDGRNNTRGSGKVDLRQTYNTETKQQTQQNQQTNVKSIKSTTLKRKDSFDSNKGSRTRSNDLSDSDTEVQNRLLAKASGSIPIEYISIRRDNPTPPPQQEKKTKSISVGTNTNVERGKRIASTNTDEPQLPSYNLHLSLDSLFQKNKREASTSTDRKKLKDAFTVTDDQDTDSEVYRVRSEKCINILPVVEHRSRKTTYEVRRSPDYRLEFLAKSPSVMRRKEYHHHHHEHHKQTRVYHDEDTDVSDNEHFVRKHQNAEINMDDDDRLIFGDLTKIRSGSYPTCRLPLSNLSENLVKTKRYVKQSKNTTYYPNQRILNDQYQLTMMPLTKYQEQNGANSMWNSKFDEMNMKFNQVFSNQNMASSHQQQQIFQPFMDSQPKTERYYKYSKTTTNDVLPSFGEIYTRNQHHSLQNRQQYHQNYEQQQQQQQQFKSPIIEMPQTPNSTIRSKRTYSYGDSNIHQSSTLRNGPIITQLTPTPSDINAPVTNRFFSSSSSSSTRQQQQQQQQQQRQQVYQQQAANEQFIRKAQSCTNLEPNNATSSYSYQFSSNQKNGQNIDSERHFIPINVNNS